ncbi:MAG: 2,3-bisphosphoglycerate-independent phosphoglycerate mutase [Rhodospirillales bacterium]
MECRAARAAAHVRPRCRVAGGPDGQLPRSATSIFGAGRIVQQELVRIGDAVADGSIARAPALQTLIQRTQRTGGTCHLFGLVSDGGVHSHMNHGIALARLVADAGIPVAIHIITDGRDTGPRTADGFVHEYVNAVPRNAILATIGGRYYAMDRDNRWDRVQRAYAAMAEAKGPYVAAPPTAIRNAYARDITDEFIPPSVVERYTGMQHGDSLLCFNFRADRVREILTALLDPAFDHFPHTPKRFAAAVGMTSYGDALADRMGTIFPPTPLTHNLGEVVAAAGRTQLRIAETEKYPHVTYFLNGGEETPYPGEDRIMVPSPKVATYDLQPEMSAAELTEKAVGAIDSGKYDLIVLNFANPDMVGHTGSLPAAIRAVEAVDAGLGRNRGRGGAEGWRDAGDGRSRQLRADA